MVAGQSIHHSGGGGVCSGGGGGGTPACKCMRLLCPIPRSRLHAPMCSIMRLVSLIPHCPPISFSPYPLLVTPPYTMLLLCMVFRSHPFSDNCLNTHAWQSCCTNCKNPLHKKANASTFPLGRIPVHSNCWPVTIQLRSGSLGPSILAFGACLDPGIGVPHKRLVCLSCDQSKK